MVQLNITQVHVNVLLFYGATVFNTENVRLVTKIFRGEIAVHVGTRCCMCSCFKLNAVHCSLVLNFFKFNTKLQCIIQILITVVILPQAEIEEMYS